MQSIDFSGGFPALFQGRNWKLSGYWKLGGCPSTRTLGVEKHVSISTPGCASRIWVEVQVGLGRRQQRAPRALSKWTGGDQWGTSKWAALQRGPHPMPGCLGVWITKSLNLLGLFSRDDSSPYFYSQGLQKSPSGEEREKPENPSQSLPFFCVPEPVILEMQGKRFTMGIKRLLKELTRGPGFPGSPFSPNPGIPLGGEKES